ncbi:MAG: hypothetical protein ABIV43_03590 [Candidatus Saccharimonadales bacterium]
MNKIQYTIRNIPEPIDQVMRKRATETGKSFNQTVLDALTEQVFGSDSIPVADDFAWLKGSLELDDEFDATVAALSQIDQEMWRETTG